MNRLKDLLDKVKDSNISNSFDDSQNLFVPIAEELMCNNIICKGEKAYAIVEIEFYLYSPKHKDWITYPRNFDAGKWFFHQSGVDLTFGSHGVVEQKTQESKKGIIIKEDAIFGGILIRGLYDLEERKYIFGPLKCVNEIWQDFDAFCPGLEEYPIIKTATHSDRKGNLMCCKRCINVDEDKKAEIWAKDWSKWLGTEMDVKEYKEYNDDLFRSKDKYLYRYYSLRYGEDARYFSEIPVKSRPLEWYPVKTE